MIQYGQQGVLLDTVKWFIGLERLGKVYQRILAPQDRVGAF
jgi:hypothetical protein